MLLPPNLLLQSRYRVVQLIGQGGMGAVYEAIDQRLDQRVALKQIVRGDAAAFEREARLLARLRHPSLPHVTDHFIDDEGQFLVMDYVSGDDLATALLRRTRPFSLETVLPWADQLLATLTYLHTQEPPIVHRDIKPANLKLTKNNRLILLDFGLAKGHSGLTSEPQKSAVGYTLAYAAPEQIRGEGTDARSDLYSAAATLYHLLTGIRPLDAIHRAVTLAGGHPDPLTAAAPAVAQLSPLLLTILRRAMALHADDRFPDAATLQAALHAVGPGDLTEVVTPSVATTPTPALILSPSPPPLAGIPNNLPAQLTPLLGRDAEVATLCELLGRPDVRLVTLTGAGGSGKTTLALAVTRRMATATEQPWFRDGIYFINLAPIQDPALVASAVAQVLGVKEAAGQLILAALQERLRTQHTLLLLDNFEQIVTAAPILSDLLTACANLKIIVTSREVLRVRGEYEFLVPLLALPKLNAQASIAALEELAAVQLFVQRVQAIKPAFLLDESNAAAVAEIVTRLDGLPLAIELAATHSKLLSPQAILARLQDRFKLLRSNVRDLPDRQRTLRATIDWSYDLLTPDEQTLFRRLAVFVGGRTLPAIEAVCNPQVDAEIPPLQIDLIDGLTALMDKSLLYQAEGADGESRFLMLVTIREYALERLVTSQEDKLLQYQHAIYYIALAEETDSKLKGTEQEYWLNYLEAEHDNLRAALRWSAQKHEDEFTLRFGAALWRFWERRSHISEGRQWLESILNREHTVSAVIEANALNGAGNLARMQNDYAIAKEYHQKALALRRKLDDKMGIAASLNNLGNVALAQFDYKWANELYAESLLLHRELGDRWGEALVNSNLSVIYRDHGDFTKAKFFLEQSLLIRQEINDLWGIATSLGNLGVIAHDLGQFSEAETDYQSSLKIWHRLNDQSHIASDLLALGWLRQAQGNLDSAQTLHEESLSISKYLNAQDGIAHALHNLASVARDKDDFTQARTLYQESLRILQELKDKTWIERSYREIATLLQREENLAGATKLLGAAEGVRSATGISLPPWLESAYLRQADELQVKLGEAEFSREWNSGRSMSLEQAVAYVLSEIALC